MSNEFDDFNWEDEADTSPENQTVQSPRRTGVRGVLGNIAGRAAGAAQNSRVRDAIEAARPIAEAVAKGAAEGTGMVRFDDDGEAHVRKARVVRGVLRPTKTARKAITGAVKGAKRGVRQEVQHKVAGAARDAFPGSRGTDSLPAAREEIDDWGYPTEASSAPIPIRSAYDELDDWTSPRGATSASVPTPGPARGSRFGRSRAERRAAEQAAAIEAATQRDLDAMNDLRGTDTTDDWDLL